MTSAPVIAVGGIGGSGTRVVSAIAQKAGLFFGDDQNPAMDALPFTLFFNIDALTEDDRAFRARAELFRAAFLRQPLTDADKSAIRTLLPRNKLQQSDEWMRERADRLLTCQGAAITGRWGWKSPPTHFFADRFLDLWSNFKFVMVYRDAADMALSRNQNQLRFWGPHMPDGPFADTRDGAFRFWCAMHRRILRAKKASPARVLMLSLEQLCKTPVTMVDKLLDFLEVDISADVRAELYTIPQLPASVGRGAGLTFDVPPEDMSFARNFAALVSAG